MVGVEGGTMDGGSGGVGSQVLTYNPYNTPEIESGGL